MKKIIMIFCTVVLSFAVIWSLIEAIQANNVQEGIADKIIRFHVIANSDSKEDQELKLTVKNKVVAYMEQLLEEANGVVETRKIIIENMDKIEATARQALEEEGSVYPVRAELARCYFPVKTYGDITFPDGEYEALRITIGNAEGKNWWCVMYPKLCFVDSLYTVVPEESKRELKRVLTEEEYRQVLYGEGNKIQIRFKLLDYAKSVLKR